MRASSLTFGILECSCSFDPVALATGLRLLKNGAECVCVNARVLLNERVFAVF